MHERANELEHGQEIIMDCYGYDRTTIYVHTRPRGEVVLVPEQIPQSQWIR